MYVYLSSVRQVAAPCNKLRFYYRKFRYSNQGQGVALSVLSTYRFYSIFPVNHGQLAVVANFLTDWLTGKACQYNISISPKNIYILLDSICTNESIFRLSSIMVLDLSHSNFWTVSCKNWVLTTQHKWHWAVSITHSFVVVYNPLQHYETSAVLSDIIRCKCRISKSPEMAKCGG